MTSPTVASFAVAMCQASVFTPDEEVSPARFSKKLLPAWSTRFDADPFAIPNMPGLPVEVPRLVLNSKANLWRCELATARINFYWNNPDPLTQKYPANDIYTELRSLVSDFLAAFEPRVARLAAVVHRISANDSPGRTLATHFCAEQWHKAPFNRPENFELHAHKRYALGSGTKVNSWVRNKTAFATRGPTTNPVILVEQDLNTLAEDAQNAAFTTQQVSAFFEAAPTEFDSILKLYYPGAA